MNYINKTTGHLYTGGAMTRKVGNTVFTGIPTSEQLQAWGYEEVPPTEPYTPTDDDMKRQRMEEIVSELQLTDYLALKAFEGEDMSEHLGWKEKRAALREEYRKLENELNNK